MASARTAVTDVFLDEDLTIRDVCSFLMIAIIGLLKTIFFCYLASTHSAINTVISP